MRRSYVWYYVLALIVSITISKTPLEPIKAFIASLMFLLMPFNVGLLLYLPISKLLKGGVSEGIAPVFLSWLLGYSLLSLIGGLLLYINAFNFSTLLYIAITLSLLPLASRRVNGIVETLHINIRRIGYKRVLCLLFLSLIPIIYLKYYTPFPLTISPDQVMFHGLTLETLRSHPPRKLWHINYFSFYLMGALLCGLCNCEPLSLYWMIVICLYPLYALAIYLLSRRIKDDTTSFLAALLVPWLQGWVMGSAPYLFLPRTLLMLLYPLILYVILDESVGSLNPKSYVTLLLASSLPIIYYLPLWLNALPPLTWLTSFPLASMAFLYLASFKRRISSVALILGIASLLACLTHGRASLIYSVAVAIPLFALTVRSINHRYSLAFAYLLASIAFLSFISKWPGWSYLTINYAKLTPS